MTHSRFTTHQHILGPQAMWKVFLDGRLIGFIKQEVDEFRFTPRDSVVPGDAFESMPECLGSLFISDEKPVEWKPALQVGGLLD